MDELLPLLAARGVTAAGGLQVHTAYDVAAQLAKLTVEQRAALVDGTFVPVGRPAGWEAQQPFSSSHRGSRHTRNFTAFTDDRGPAVGRRRLPRLDSRPHRARRQPTGRPLTFAASGATVIGDKACRGIAGRLGLAAAFTPRPKRRKRQPPAGRVAATEADPNRELSSQRVRVEHAIRRLKVHRVLHGYRLSARRFDTVINAVATITTMPA
jgi:hypothetical protein